MVWTCAEEGQLIYIGRKMLEMELPGRRQRGDMIYEIHRCSEGGHAGSWNQSERYREQGKMENSNSLWQPLKRDKTKGKEEEANFLLYRRRGRCELALLYFIFTSNLSKSNFLQNCMVTL